MLSQRIAPRALAGYLLFATTATLSHAASLPSATLGAASNVTATSARLNGSVAPNGSATTVAFQHGTTTAYGTIVYATPFSISASASATNVSASVSGLKCGTTYHYQIGARNSYGDQRTGDGTFTTTACATTPPPPTPIAPTASTNSASGISQTQATLNGAASAGSATATLTFDYGTSTAYGSSRAATPGSIAGGAGSTSISSTLTGLACGTTYHYRARAVSTAGTVTGSNQSFATSACSTPPPTPVAPTATTSAPSSIAQTQATLRGAATAGSATATLSFDYGPSTAYGSSIGATPGSIVGGTGSTATSATIASLTCGTTYHYRARAVSSVGTVTGSNQSFATSACSTPPPPSGTLDCTLTNVRCVAPTAGPNQEYSTIQAAVNAAVAGDTVQVFDGNYVGFVVSKSGTASARITVKAAADNAVIDRVSSAGEGIRVNNSSYVTIEGFRVTGLPSYGIAARGASATSPMHGIVFRDNVVSNCVSSNIYASQAADSLIEGNISYGSKDSHGIYLANGGSDNTVIRGNVLYGNYNNGIHLNGDLSIGGDGLHTGVTIEDNVIYDNVANGMDLDGVQSSTIRNNVVYNNGRHGVRVFQIDGASGPRNLTIANNTIVVKSGNTPIKLTEDGGGHTIFNNILVNEGTSGGSIVTGHASFKSDRNMFVNPGFSINGGSSMLTLAQWRASAGAYDPSSLTSTAAALFVAAASRDYRLRAGAPAANAGMFQYNGTQAPVEDIAGVARPLGGAVDQGAYESF